MRGGRRGRRLSRPRTVDLRPAAERRARRAWAGRPGAGLRAASLLYGLATDARNFLYDVGLLATRSPAVPVVSVGGLSVGGSGKTPLAAELARLLAEEGRRPAVVTHGFPDEMAVHRSLNPGLPVAGGGDRVAAVGRAAAAGAGVAVVDSGFQHRRLARACDVLAVGAGELAGARRRLPAGPLRERWSALGRADAIVLVRRPGDAPEPEGIGTWLGARLRGTTRARLLLRPTGLAPANAAARRAAERAPAVAVASVMHPAPFFRSLEEQVGAGFRRYVLSDHRAPDEDALASIEEDAGESGVVGTRKDVVKLGDRLDPAVPLWCLDEEARWEAGRDAVTATIARALEDAR